MHGQRRPRWRWCHRLVATARRSWRMTARGPTVPCRATYNGLLVPRSSASL